MNETCSIYNPRDNEYVTYMTTRTMNEICNIYDPRDNEYVTYTVELVLMSHYWDCQNMMTINGADKVGSIT